MEGCGGWTGFGCGKAGVQQEFLERKGQDKVIVESSGFPHAWCLANESLPTWLQTQTDFSVRLHIVSTQTSLGSPRKRDLSSAHLGYKNHAEPGNQINMSRSPKPSIPRAQQPYYPSDEYCTRMGPSVVQGPQSSRVRYRFHFRSRLSIC